MTGISRLKISASISLGIHLLFIGIVSGLFQGPKIHSTTTLHNVKVTLLPMVTQEKPDAKVILPVPLKVGDQDPKGLILDRKEKNQNPFSPHPFVAQNISFEEPSPISKNKGAEKTSDDLLDMAKPLGSGSDTDSKHKNEGNRVSSREVFSTGGDLFVSLPSLHSGESSGGTFSFNRSGDGKGPGIGSENGGPGNGGSVKGKGIFGKIFSSRGGGNGAQPRYAENPKPIYPQEAREKGYEGEVVLRVEVLINGRVGQIEIKKSSGYALLDHSALTTVKQWRFIPAKKDDIAIPLWVNIPVKFQLQ